MRILFEDNPDSPVSRLLKQSIYGSCIDFSCGINNLMHKLQSTIALGEDNIIVYVDVSPDNLNTFIMYERLRIFVKQHYGDRNIVVLPIPCIEFYTLKFLTDNNYLSPTLQSQVGAIFDDTFNYSALLNLTSNSCLSLERRLKAVLSNCGICYRNKLDKEYLLGRADTSISGKFYIEDCGGCGVYCNSGALDTLSIKANRLYFSLPIVFCDVSTYDKQLREWGITCRVLYNFEYDAQEILYNLYSKIEQDMGVLDGGVSTILQY